MYLILSFISHQNEGKHVSYNTFNLVLSHFVFILCIYYFSNIILYTHNIVCLLYISFSFNTLYIKNKNNEFLYIEY